jgi:hypothetical integral membrane protein (TIGR02206 family)
MHEFIEYFFGAGSEATGVEFSNFTLAHFLPILVAVGIIFLIWFCRDKLKNCERERYFRYTLAFMLIVSEMSYYWRLIAIPELGPNPIDHLPVTVCGWAVVFSSYMVIGKSQKLYDIVYFWLFSGTIFALITPTVITYTGPTRFRYYQFWAEHTLGYIAVFYMTFVHGMRPTFKSAVRSWVTLAVLGIVAFCVNRYLGPGANYLFLAAPEDTPSVLDILPPNFALRTFIMAAVVSAMFFVSYLPWFIKDRKAKKKELANA